jgi:DNA-binding MurR/RpiR family transcriptional regulator
MTDEARPVSLAVRIRGLLPSLSRAEQRVGTVIVEEAATAAAMTITELARRAGTSETTVIRFCRAIGVSGYPELRLTLAAEAGRARDDRLGETVGGDIGRSDDLAQVVRIIAHAAARAVQDTAAQLDLEALERVVAAIAAARRVDVYGAGASGLAAQDLQHKLHRIGLTASAWPDPHLALTSAARLGPDDVAVGISHTGTTVDTIEPLAEAGRRGATTVAVTNFPESPLARGADLVLTTAARETTFRPGTMSSGPAQLTVLDCVYAGVALRAYDRATAALQATTDAPHRRPEPGPGRS